MIPFNLLCTGVTIFALLPAAQATFFYPTVEASLLEHILVDTHGSHSSGFADAITPCSNYVSGSQILGRETAAQWLRVAFHDFVTAHVLEGTGGIDASIGFETLREEDSGTAMNDSLRFFRPYVSSKVSSKYTLNDHWPCTFYSSPVWTTYRVLTTVISGSMPSNILKLFQVRIFVELSQ